MPASKISLPKAVPVEFPATNLVTYFSEETEPVKSFAHHVKRKYDAAPAAAKLRRFHLALRQPVSAELRRFEQEFKLENFDASEWISAVVFAFKKDVSIRLRV